MNKILDAIEKTRGLGNTTALIDLCKLHKIKPILVVQDQRIKWSILGNNYYLKDEDIIILDELPEKLCGIHGRPLIFDNMVIGKEIQKLEKEICNLTHENANLKNKLITIRTVLEQ